MTAPFLRHGQTITRRQRLFSGSGTDPELTAEDHEMARFFAQRYENTLFAAVYCSPLRRAQQTVAPLAARNKLSVQTRAELREISFGAWEGKTVAEVEAEYHDDYLRWSADPAWHAPTRGETALEIARRSRFRDRLDAPVASLAVAEFGTRGPLLKALADRSHLSERLALLPGS
ncbi:MAG: histidine phosphatase family protein [Proteobacteria bacterium]|nr:histidine phosphatase family protein [Pseudomonadota bacterium]